MPLRLERRDQAVAPRRVFARRMLLAASLWLAMTLLWLGIGMLGYGLTEGMSPIDAFLNASMILSGMGPVDVLKTSGGKLFAGVYAILSGLLIVVAAGFVLAPIMHRVLHAFHVEQERDDDD
jgi:hypothetical protein